MRKIFLKLKIYDHRLKTLAKENDLEEYFGTLTEMYKKFSAEETVVYYEYNYPARGYMTAVLCSGIAPEADIKAFEAYDGFDASKAAGILGDELLKEALRLIAENVNREMRSAMQAPEYIEGEKLESLKSSWPDFPAEAVDNAAVFPFKPVVFQARLGRRIGCSGGGACTQCTHPTCGKAPG